MSAKHTPTPWEVSHFGDIVGDHDNDGYVVIAQTPAPNSPSGSARRNTWNDNAALIVRAVNAHDDLVAALNLAVFMLACLEPGDSRAVSDEFVALAAVSSGIADDKTRAVISAALAQVEAM